MFPWRSLRRGGRLYPHIARQAVIAVRGTCLRRAYCYDWKTESRGITMENPKDRHAEPSTAARPALAEVLPGEANHSSPAAAPPTPSAARSPSHRRRKWLLLAAAVAALAVAGY